MGEVVSDIASKWGNRVAGRGFAQVPNYLLLLNQFLVEEKRLSPAELMILIQLVASWWRKDDLPYPALKTLAVRAGVSDRQAQRSVSRLEAMGLLKRVKRQGNGMIASNAYDLSPLVRFLDEVGKAFPNEFVRKIANEDLRRLDEVLTSETSPARVEQAKAVAAEARNKKPVRVRKPRRIISSSTVHGSV